MTQNQSTPASASSANNGATKVPRSRRGTGGRVPRKDGKSGSSFAAKLRVVKNKVSVGRRRENATGEMSLVDHIQELRRRVIIALIAVVIGTILGFIWYQYRVGPIDSLGDILRGPYCNLPPEKRADFTNDGECRLIATSPFEMFILRLKVGALAGLVLASPVWLAQIWGFITPGLHKNERRWTFSFVSSAVTLFVLGAILAYFVVSYGLEFLMSMGDEFQVAALSGIQYFNFLLALLIIFGVSFELPLLLVMLNIVGLVSYESLKDKRRLIIVGLFVFAAVMTPGQDPFSMVMLAFALSLLAELAIQFARINDKRRVTERPDWLDGDDETASQLDQTPDDIAPAAPLAGEAAVAASASEAPSPLHTPDSLSDPAPLDQSRNFDDVL